MVAVSPGVSPPIEIDLKSIVPPGTRPAASSFTRSAWTAAVAFDPIAGRHEGMISHYLSVNVK
jgi:hypothetical protein